MFINLTSNLATVEQKAEGLHDLTGCQLEALHQALADLNAEPEERAEYIAELAIQNGLGGDDDDDPIPSKALIEWDDLMPHLASELLLRGIKAEIELLN